jgi:hypothetical protein
MWDLLVSKSYPYLLSWHLLPPNLHRFFLPMLPAARVEAMAQPPAACGGGAEGAPDAQGGGVGELNLRPRKEAARRELWLRA